MNLNLRCIYCQTPFTVSHAEVLGAIIMMNEKNQSHYDVHCTKCRRANSISRQRVELAYPNWQDAAKEAASAPPASAALKTEPVKAVKAAAKKPAVKAAKAPAAKKASAKPAEKKAPAKGKKK